MNYIMILIFASSAFGSYMVGADKDYRILGLKPGSSLQEVKQAFKALALKYHPDKNLSPSAQKIFIDSQQAYQNIIASEQKEEIREEPVNKNLFDRLSLVEKASFIRDLLQKDANYRENIPGIGRPLLFAIDNNLINLALELIADGAMLSSGKNPTGNSLLHEAAARGQVELVKAMLERRRDFQNLFPDLRNDALETPLMAASNKESGSGHKSYAKALETVEALLPYQKSINYYDKNRLTALMRAVSYCQPEILKLLIDNGADIKLKNKNKETAYDLAKKQCSYLSKPKLKELLALVEIPGTKKWWDILR